MKELKKDCNLKSKTAVSGADGPKVRYNAPDFKHLYHHTKGQQSNEMNSKQKEEIGKACKSPDVSEEEDVDDDEDDDDDDADDEEDDIELTDKQSEKGN